MNNAKKKKPLRWAKHWGARVWPMAGRMAVILVAVAVMGLMFSALQAVSSIVLRDVISLAILSGILLMMYSEGLTRGVADADASHAADRLEKLGRPLTRKEESACYQPMKALCACLVVFAVPLALSLYLAATAKPYTYALQDLPAWLTGTYGAREDVMAPLAAYAQSATFTLRDGIRLVVRLAVLIYINLFPDPQTMAQMIDRLVPADGDDLSDCVHDRLSARARRLRQAAEHAAPRQKSRRAQGAEEEHGGRAAWQRRRRALRPARGAGRAQEEGAHLMRRVEFGGGF